MSQHRKGILTNKTFLHSLLVLEKDLARERREAQAELDIEGVAMGESEKEKLTGGGAGAGAPVSVNADGVKVVNAVVRT